MLDSLFIAAAGLTSTLVGSELALRAFYRRRGAAWVYEPNSIQTKEVDREALPGLQPIARTVVNSDGERGAELPSDRTSLYRVLVAGGSAAECFFLDQDTQWPSVLQRTLAARSRELGAQHVHVGNIARSLVRCESIDWMLGATLRRVRDVDMVVLMVGASDVVGWLQNGCPPEVHDERVAPERCFDVHDFGPFGWSPSRLALREGVRRFKTRLRPSRQVRERAGKALVKLRKMRAAAERWIDDVPDPAPMLRHYERWLRQCIHTARAHGAEVLIARQPWLQRACTPEESARLWNFGRGRPYEQAVTEYYSLSVVHRLLAAVDGVSARVAAEEGAAACELQSALPADFETYYDELHFTPEGAERVGQLIGEALLTTAAGRRRASAQPAAA